MKLEGALWRLEYPTDYGDIMMRFKRKEFTYELLITIEELRDIVFLAEVFFQEREKQDATQETT
jgi:hypothetical protein